MENKMKRPSLSTIAKTAGVDRSVVYTVLNNRIGKGIFVSEITKERILKIARETGYIAPKSAKELFSGKSDNIGIVLHKNSPPFSDLLNYVQHEAYQRKLEITPYITNANEDLEERYIDSARDGRVDGLIVVMKTDGSEERCRRFSRPPFNMKILCYGEPVDDVPSIHFNDVEAGRLAAEHLVAIGCKRPAFFGGDINMARVRGFKQYFEDNKLPLPLLFTGETFVGFFEDGTVLAQQFLKLKERPDGVFAANDILAVALLSAALRKGLKVPRDIAIMGCNNTEVTLYTTPTITSINTNLPLAAKKVIEILEDMIKGEKPKLMHTEIPVSLIVRESTRKTGN